MVIGAQVYTIREFTKNEADFEKSMSKLAEIGYKCVQISGIGDIPAQSVADICKKYNLKIILTHTAPNRLLNDTENVIKEHKLMGAGYIGIGSMPDAYRLSLEGVKKFIADFLPVAKKIKEAGLKFMYHNHDFEFQKFDGKLIIDYLAEGFSPDEMGFVLDTYWVTAGGGDPCYYLRKFAGRLDTIHLKDMKIQRNEEQKTFQAMAEILEGNLNWAAIFACCDELKIPYAFVEQDNCYGQSPFDCLKTSLVNISGFYKNAEF